MKNTKYFKPKAHILRLLGDELIKSPVMAIYELVKNSYDADSSYVNVEFDCSDNNENSILTIEDNGTGLTSEVIENVWLEPGTDHRKPIDENGVRIIKRSPLFNRVPMGEKGVGRFAVHKLGNKIKLITRPSKISIDDKGRAAQEALGYEITLIIDWGKFSQSKYLDDIPITWTTETDVSKFYFKYGSGTLIEVSELKEKWTRGMARSLMRNSVSMLSPKIDENLFKINLDFKNNWLDDFSGTKQILEVAPYKYTALLDEDYNLTVDYEFSLALNEDFGKREIFSKTENIKGLLLPRVREYLEKELLTEEEISEQLEALKARVNPFGSILFEIYSFDLDSLSLKNYTQDSKTLKEVLKLHSGIKVFKDEMRVFNYGEPGNDWLELDIKRVQNKEWFSNNQNIGFIYLDSEKSTKLVEKTNREGFIENEAYRIFHQSIISILSDFKIERMKDRNKFVLYLKSESDTHLHPDPVSVFNALIDSTDFSDDEKKEKLKHESEKLTKDFNDKKETLLIPAGVGMTASIALHEMEKIVPRLKETVNSVPFKNIIANTEVEELEDCLKGILSVLRKGGSKSINLNESIEKSISNYSSKLNRRNISTVTKYDDDAKTIKCDKRYFITMIMNIIDNSIYWLDTIYKKDKGIYIKTIVEGKKTSVFIIDNGPGFKDEITDIVRPFFTRKEDGIGIGMYLIDTIMMKYGKLEIIESNEELDLIGIPSMYRGAAVKLTFKES